MGFGKLFSKLKMVKWEMARGPKGGHAKMRNWGSVHTDENYCTTIIVVFDSYLGFTTRSLPWAGVILVDFTGADT